MAAAPAMLAVLRQIVAIKDDCPAGAEMDGETASIMAELARDAISELGQVGTPQPETDAGGFAWEDDPQYPRADWQTEVANGDPSLGYVDWRDDRKSYAGDS